MKKTALIRYLGVLSVASFLPLAQAEITTAMQAKLGNELTPMGANPKANADGTIPAWQGNVLGTPKGLAYEGPGKPYPNPYASEKPRLSVTAQNMEEYREHLTDGQVALFKKYPETYRIDVYPSHREFRYNEQMEKRTMWNVGHTKLVNGLDGLQQYTGGAPFPIPQNGAQVVWNARINQPMAVSDALSDEVAVYANGKQQRYRTQLILESPYAYSSHPIGKAVEEIGPVAAYVFHEVLEPRRKKGEMVVVHEPLDYVKNDRKAWVYIPGAQRVRRAPTVGYDTPAGPGGLITVDDNAGFNGAMDRFDWKLIGKKEIFIPYHTYKFDSPDVKYEELLGENHVNPDYMRYEQQRVWVVEATLKSDKRHVYGKRRFYIAEDTWLIGATDIYDGRGDLWRIGQLNSVYDFFLKGYVLRTHVSYDLQASAYVAVGLVNESRPVDYDVDIRGADFYTPNNLRKLGR